MGVQELPSAGSTGKERYHGATTARFINTVPLVTFNSAYTTGAPAAINILAAGDDGDPPQPLQKSQEHVKSK